MTKEEKIRERMDIAVSKAEAEDVSFDDDSFVDYYLENQPILSEKEEMEQMDRIIKGCDLIRELNMRANIPEPI
jgi:hypothetical protein